MVADGPSVLRDQGGLHAWIVQPSAIILKSKEKELVGEHSLPMLSLVVRGTSAGVWCEERCSRVRRKIEECKQRA
jgi:hypothetical protein